MTSKGRRRPGRVAASMSNGEGASQNDARIVARLAVRFDGQGALS